MNFTHPFSRIYAEVMAKTYDQYLRDQRRDRYKALYTSRPEQTKEGIEGILNQDTLTLATKLQVDASLISDRLKLTKEHYDTMLYNWFDVRNKMLELEPGNQYQLRDSTRFTSTLQNQLTSISSEILNEKIRCWHDLVDPMRSFLDTWDRYEQQKLERKLVGDLQ
jgi:hypothetical protein